MIALALGLATLARLAAPYLAYPFAPWALIAAAGLWSVAAAATLACHFAIIRAAARA